MSLQSSEHHLCSIVLANNIASNPHDGTQSPATKEPFLVTAPSGSVHFSCQHAKVVPVLPPHVFESRCETCGQFSSSSFEVVPFLSLCRRGFQN